MWPACSEDAPWGNPPRSCILPLDQGLLWRSLCTPILSQLCPSVKAEQGGFPGFFPHHEHLWWPFLIWLGHRLPSLTVVYLLLIFLKKRIYHTYSKIHKSKVYGLMDFDTRLYCVTTSHIKTLSISIIPEGSLMPSPSQHPHPPSQR